jgi:hypothetical protein
MLLTIHSLLSVFMKTSSYRLVQCFSKGFEGRALYCERSSMWQFNSYDLSGFFCQSPEQRIILK